MKQPGLRQPERGAAGFVGPDESCPPSLRAPEFVVKDSGSRTEFMSGMVRDTEDGKPDLLLIRTGPMFNRWTTHLMKGAVKYGRDNWTLASSEEELERFKRSAARHFEQWLRDERDEDHGAAVFFNINAAEYVENRLKDRLWTPPHDLC